MDSEEHEQQLDNLTEKEILLELLAEIKTIRYGLQTGNFGTLEQQEQERSESEIYLCKTCTDEVKESQRKQHLIKKHNAPAQISVEEEFAKA